MKFMLKGLKGLWNYFLKKYYFITYIYFNTAY